MTASTTTSATASTTTSTTTTSSTSTTTTTVSASTTTTVTTAFPSTTTTTTVSPVTLVARSQAVSDLFESVALQQAALSHILNAEGEKLQKIFSFEEISPDTVLQANKSVEGMIHSIANLETVLEQKLALFEDCICKND